MEDEDTRFVFDGGRGESEMYYDVVKQISDTVIEITDTDVFQMAMSILRRTLTHDRIYKIRKNI